MENKCPPDNFNELVMAQIKDVEIEKKLSPYALCFVTVSSLICFLVAIVIEKQYFIEVLESLGLYDVIGKYYNSFIAFEESFIKNGDIYSVMAILLIIAGIYFIINSLMFGVNKNG